MAAHQAPPSLGFSRQEHWSGLPFPSPMHESEKWKWSHSVVSDSSRPHGLQPTRLLRPWDFPGKSTGVGCHCLLLVCWVKGKEIESWSAVAMGWGRRRVNVEWQLTGTVLFIVAVIKKKISKIYYGNGFLTLWIYTKNQWIEHFKWINVMVYKLGLSKTFKTVSLNQEDF